MTRPVRLENVIDPDELRQAKAAGWVTERRHGSLRILNYTAKCAAERAWNRTTRECRGLIHDDGTVIARPFAKFFSAGDPSGPDIPRGAGWTVSVHDKLDGSLGIGYRDPSTGRCTVASRGSLASDHAATADRIWRTKHRSVEIPDGITPVFEIISPAHRIIVDYGMREDLVLLGVIDIATGSDLSTEAFRWNGPTATAYPASDWSDALQIVDQRTAAGEDFEGVVAVWRGPGGETRRFKIKSRPYLERHEWAYRWPVRRIWQEAAGRHLISELGVTDAGSLGGLLRIDREWCEDLLRRTAADGGRDLRSIAADGPERESRHVLGILEEIQSQAAEYMAEYRRLAEAVGAAPAGRGGRRQHAAAVDEAARSRKLRPGPLFSLCDGKPAAAWAAVWRDVLEAQRKSA